ncbi:MAG: TIGR03087 family PEP-CTERM/XrtA system glycosyltransferase [Qipengyuania sp.]
MGDILFLAHRMPFPPDRGDKIRSHHLLRALARVAPVHVGTFTESASDREQEQALAELARTYILPRRRKSLARAAVEALASSQPVSLTAFEDRRLREWVRTTLAGHPIDTIVIFSGQMGQYVPDEYADRVIIDLCDVDSAKFSGYARDAALPRRWLYTREERLLAAEEERLARRADRTLLISESELELFQTRLQDPTDISLEALGNGVDTEFFDPEATCPHPEIAGSQAAQFLFAGQMDYPPNIAAAMRFAKTILHAIRSKHEAQFHIVGRAPTSQVKALASLPGVRVWGEVSDIRPFLVAADAVVAPLTLGRGVQNKVLEAMAMARPILLSPEAATGIAARDGEHFRICRNDEAFAAAADDLLRDPQAARSMGDAARNVVVEHMSWAAFYADVGRLAGGSPARSRHAA